MWYNVSLDTLEGDDDKTPSKNPCWTFRHHVGLFRFKVLYWRVNYEVLVFYRIE